MKKRPEQDLRSGQETGDRRLGTGARAEAELASPEDDETRFSSGQNLILFLFPGTSLVQLSELMSKGVDIWGHQGTFRDCLELFELCLGFLHKSSKFFFLFCFCF